MDQRATEVVRFWFGDSGDDVSVVAGRWYKKDPAFDATVRTRFGDLAVQAARNDLDSWSNESADPRETLALLVLLDQFPRNLFRESQAAFENDSQALAICRAAIGRGVDRKLTFLERGVFYLPMMHTEDRDVQRESVATYEHLVREARDAHDPLAPMLENSLDFARKHAAIVDRFGRFPHRNKVLGRASTAEEEAFLLEPGSSF